MARGRQGTGRRAFAALALMAALAGPALPDVEEDEGVLVRLVQGFLSDAGREVRIRGFEGALSSRATIRELSIADAQGVWITLGDVVIDWNRGALLNRQIEVNELSAARIDVFRNPNAPDDGPDLPSPTARPDFELPELPVSVRIGSLHADVVQFDAALFGQPATISISGGALLVGGQGEAHLDAVRTDGAGGAFRLAGAFDNTSRVLRLDTTLDEGAGGIASTLLGIPDLPAMGLRVQGEGPISTFGADIVVSTDGLDRVRGRFALVDATPDTGVLQGGGFSLDIEGDLRPLLVADLHPFFGARASLRATGQRSDVGEITLPELAITTGAMALTGSAAIAPNGVPRSVALSAAIGRDTDAPVLLPGTDGAATILGAALTIAYDEAQSRDWTMRARLDTLGLPGVSVGAAVLDARGRLNPPNVSSAGGEPLFEGVFEFAAEGLAADDPALQSALGDAVFGLASLSWAGAQAPLDLTGLAFEGDTVSLTASGQFTGAAFDGFAEFEVPDLSDFAGLAERPLAGQALATFEGRANPLTGALDFEAELATRDLVLGLPEADTFLAGRAAIGVSLLRDINGTVLRDLTVTAGTAEFTALGMARPGFTQASSRLVVADLARLGPGYGGRVALDAEFTGENGTSRLRLDGSVIDLQLGDLPGAEVLGRALRGANRMRADLTMRGGQTDIALFTLQGPQLALSATGHWSGAAPDLALTLERLDAAALVPGATGSVSGLVRAQGDGDGIGYDLDLRAPAGLAIGQTEVDSLLANGVTVLAQARMGADGGLDLRSARVQAGVLSVDASGRIGADGATRLGVEAAVEDLARLVPGIGGPAQADITLSRAAGEGRYALRGTLGGPRGMDVRLGGFVNDDLTLAATLTGQVEAATINPIIEPASVQGVMRLDGTLTGPPGIEALRLSARIQDGRFALPEQGVAFHNIVASAQMTGLRSVVRVVGDSLSGGRVSLAGSIHLNGRNDAELDVAAQGLIVSHPQLFDAEVNGALRIVGPLNVGALASGTLEVTRGEIRIPHSPLARQGVGIAGLRHIGDDAASRRTRVNAGIATGTRLGRPPVPLLLDVTLTAPGRIFVRGRGLDAELGGTLRLGGDTLATVPSGSFRLIRGRLDLLGNRFTLTDGSASMIGDFLPLISLTATTESGGVLTSVTLAGPADSPVITFSSVPELPQDEVLARLIFRRSLASLSPFQAAQLALSVATLTGQAEQSLLGRTRQAMGLDDLDFTIDEAGNSRLRAGRAITERVYSDVSIDSGGRSEVSINLDLTPNVRLRGRADSEGGSGVGLFFERDY